MIANHFEAGDFLQVPAADQATYITSAPDSSIGSMIGPYKLREVLGEGGMGIVCAAEQEKPVRHKVALKLIKPGMDSLIDTSDPDCTVWICARGQPQSALFSMTEAYDRLPVPAAHDRCAEVPPPNKWDAPSPDTGGTACKAVLRSNKKLKSGTSYLTRPSQRDSTTNFGKVGGEIVFSNGSHRNFVLTPVPIP